MRKQQLSLVDVLCYLVSVQFWWWDVAFVYTWMMPIRSYFNGINVLAFTPL